MMAVASRDEQREAAGGAVAAPIARDPAAALAWPVVRSAWWQPAARVAVLAGSDLLALVGSAAFAFLLWARPVHHQGPWMYADLAPILAVFIVGYALSGLYPGFGLGAVEVVRRLSLRTSFVFVVLAAALFALRMPTYYSRVTLVLAWATSLIAVPGLRYLVLNFVSRWPWWGLATVLVGDADRVLSTINLLNRAVSLGYRPTALLEPGSPSGAAAVAGIPFAGGLECAERLAAAGATTALVVDGDTPAGNALGGRLQRHFRHVVLLRTFDQLPVEGVAIRNLGGILGIEYRNDLLGRGDRVTKRTLDLVLGAASLVLAVPVIALAAALVKLVSRGPTFFVQEREGAGGTRIRVRKLRTMYGDAEERLDEFLDGDPAARREWETRYKLPHDPRVIPVVGTLLRRFSIDELPQLWNVVTGEMSLVGPRPFPEYHLSQFPPDFRELRRHVRPGITGLWQVMVRSDGSIDEQLLFDTHYIRNWSVWMDLYILAKTPLVVVQGKGAY